MIPIHLFACELLEGINELHDLVKRSFQHCRISGDQFLEDGADLFSQDTRFRHAVSILFLCTGMFLHDLAGGVLGEENSLGESLHCPLRDSLTHLFLRDDAALGAK